MPTNPAFFAAPRSPQSQRSQPKRTAASTATRTGPAGSTLRRYFSSCAAKSSQHGIDTTRVPIPLPCSRSRAASAISTSEPVAIRIARRRPSASAST